LSHPLSTRVSFAGRCQGVKAFAFISKSYAFDISTANPMTVRQNLAIWEKVICSTVSSDV
jgi:hypothetical protein